MGYLGQKKVPFHRTKRNSLVSSADGMLRSLPLEQVVHILPTPYKGLTLSI
jgi:hypothetical protein